MPTTRNLSPTLLGLALLLALPSCNQGPDDAASAPDLHVVKRGNLRITVGDPDQNDRLINSLRNASES